MAARALALLAAERVRILARNWSMKCCGSPHPSCPVSCNAVCRHRQGAVVPGIPCEGHQPRAHTVAAGAEVGRRRGSMRWESREALKLLRETGLTNGRRSRGPGPGHCRLYTWPRECWCILWVRKEFPFSARARDGEVVCAGRWVGGWYLPVATWQLLVIQV